MRAKRIDRNHKPIRDELRSILGKENVVDTHDLGKGFGDIIVGFRGVNYIFEIKYPGCSLTPDESDFHSKWDGQVAIANTVKYILEVIGYE